MEMVSSYCHLGHVVTSNLYDSPDYKLFICVAHNAHVCRPAVVNCGTVSCPADRSLFEMAEVRPKSVNICHYKQTNCYLLPLL